MPEMRGLLRPGPAEVSVDGDLRREDAIDQFSNTRDSPAIVVGPQAGVSGRCHAGPCPVATAPTSKQRSCLDLCGVMRDAVVAHRPRRMTMRSRMSETSHASCSCAGVRPSQASRARGCRGAACRPAQAARSFRCTAVTIPVAGLFRQGVAQWRPSNSNQEPR